MLAGRLATVVSSVRSSKKNPNGASVPCRPTEISWLSVSLQPSKEIGSAPGLCSSIHSSCALAMVPLQATSLIRTVSGLTGVGAGEGIGVGSTVGVLVIVGRRVGVDVPVAGLPAVGVVVDRSVSVGGAGELLAVKTGLPVALDVAVAVGVGVAVGLSVGVGVALAVGVAVGVAEGVAA